MKDLIGCEESGVMRRAFRARGRDAWSCDKQPSRDNSIYHHQRDIMELLASIPDKGLDLVILHPDCTTVAVCGNKHYAGTVERTHQINWMVDLWELAKTKAERVALENPASVIFPVLRRLGATIQYVQPWEFGHPEQKKTGFALHNLPELYETANVYSQMLSLPIVEQQRIFHMTPDVNRKRDRSETYTGIAEACADQWGSL